MKNKQSKIKPLKTRKEIGTHNFKLQEIKTTNKVLREKSNCVVRWSKKLRFSKQKHNKK